MVEAAWTAKSASLTPFVSAQNFYNLLERNVERELVPACNAYGLGVLPYFPLASGLLTGKYQRGQAAPAGTRLSAARFAAALNRRRTSIGSRSSRRSRPSRGHSLLELAIGWLASQPHVAERDLGRDEPRAGRGERARRGVEALGGRARQSGGAVMAEQRAIDTGTDHLQARVEDGVALLDDEPARAAQRALGRDAARPRGGARATPRPPTDVRCIVLTGAGGAFCSGGDVKGMAAGTGGNRGIGLSLDERIHRQRLSQRETAGRIFRMPKPVIASLPGAAAGAGLSLALACDLRIAAESAVITTAFAKVGFSGDYGGSYFLTQLVGSAKARELYYLSDRVDAKEAERLGLVNRVVPDAALDAETRALARPARSRRHGRLPLHEGEPATGRSSGASLEECLDLEATHHVHTGLTEDHREAAKRLRRETDADVQGALTWIQPSSKRSSTRRSAISARR